MEHDDEVIDARGGCFDYGTPTAVDLAAAAPQAQARQESAR
ncbi:MAG TPA: hypothetical protein PLK29_10235 [Chiayiivirga sp.]|jgi:hypothetical protein|nr:hypothetical protein [Chiayiivirga sp.]